MKFYSIATTIYVALIISLSPAQAQNNSFVQLAQKALAHDARLPSAYHALQAAKENLKINEASLYPQISAIPNYNFAQQKTNTARTNTNYAAYQIRANWAIYDSSRDYELLAYKDEVESLNFQRDKTQQTILLEVILARLQLHIAIEQIAQINQRLNGIQEQLKLAQTLEQQGVGNKLDVFLIEAEIATIKNEKATLQDNEMTQRQTLKKLTQSAIGQLPKLPAQFTFPALEDKGSFIEAVLKNNPELNSSTKTLSAYKNREQSAKEKFKPTFSVSNQHTQTSENNRSTEISFQLNIPIFDGGSRKAQEYYYNEQKLSYDHSIKNYRDSLLLDIENLYQQAQTIERQQQFLKQAINHRQNILEKNKVAWKEGINSAQTVIESEQNLFLSQQNLITLSYQYLIVIARLQSLKNAINDDFLTQLDQYFAP